MPFRRLVLNGIRVALLVTIAFTLVVPTAFAACPGNIALNVGFEEGASDRGSGEIIVANGWEPFWQPRGEGDGEGMNFRPQFEMEDASRHGTQRIREGNWSQKLWNTYATHHAGVFQRVNVQAGSTVNLSAWGQSWTSSADDTNVSKDGQYFMSVGIDPTGGTDFNSGNIIWSEKNPTNDQWVQLQVSAKAQGGTVTLFLRGDASWPVKYNVCHFDEVCVTSSAPAAQPTAKPQPTNTPEPTAPPEPTAVPEPTEAPEEAEEPEEPAAPQPTPTAIGGSISAYVFEDRDGNGQRGSTEPLLAGAQIELTDMGQNKLAARTTDGASEPFAFDGLAAGQYIVTETDPSGYASTSPNQWAVSLSPGADVEIYFADRFAPPTATATRFLPTATPAAEPTTAAVVETPEPSKTPAWRKLYRVSGITIALLALLLPILFRFLRDSTD